MVIFSLWAANILPIINLPMALGNLLIAANGLQLVLIANNIHAVLSAMCGKCGSGDKNNQLKYSKFLV